MGAGILVRYLPPGFIIMSGYSSMAISHFLLSEDPSDTL